MTLNRPPFTAMQRQLLALFRANADRVLSRDEIMDHLWGVEYDGYPNVVDKHVANLRARLGDGWGRHLERHIRTMPGVGYRWVHPGEAP